MEPKLVVNHIEGTALFTEEKALDAFRPIEADQTISNITFSRDPTKNEPIKESIPSENNVLADVKPAAYEPVEFSHEDVVGDTDSKGLVMVQGEDGEIVYAQQNELQEQLDPVCVLYSNGVKSAFGGDINKIHENQLLQKLNKQKYILRLSDSIPSRLTAVAELAHPAKLPEIQAVTSSKTGSTTFKFIAATPIEIKISGPLGIRSVRSGYNLKPGTLSGRDFIGVLSSNIQRTCHQYFNFRDPHTALVMNINNFPVPVMEIDEIEEESEVNATLCSYCSFYTPDPNICQRCRRPLVESNKLSPSDISTNGTVVQSPVSKRSSSDKYKGRERSPRPGSSRDSDSSPSKSDKYHRHLHRKKCRKFRKVEPEPEPDITSVSLVSSDEEEEARLQNGEYRVPPPLTDVFSKEPVITAETEPHFPHETLRGGGVELEELIDNPDIERIRLDCRSVRFGSYKVKPLEPIVVTEQGIKIRVPGHLKSGPATVIKILMQDIVKVLIHFGISGSSSTAPAFFYYVTHDASKRIREALNMLNKNNKGFYFDSTSKEEVHKRITLLPETVSQPDRLFIKSIYESRCLMEELSWDEANDILVRAAPKDVQHNLKKDAPAVKHMPSATNPPNLQVIMVYPPPPITGGISINNEDYACLKEDQFLNDVIIDFYLKYLWLNVLSEEDKKRTHILSSFFYKRLTMMSHRPANTKDVMSPAEKRHARVKNWTKTVDIFEKDFIIIPINERSHWFLGIICFPGLTGPVRMSDNTPLPDPKKKDTSVLAGGDVPAKIWGTTISLVKPPNEKPSAQSRSISLIERDEDKGDESERDEAEADDDDMEPDLSDPESQKDMDDLMDEATPRVSKAKPPQEPIKQPCILIFDSLACASRSRVCATLREYLQVEWKVKHKGKHRDFSKEVFKGAVPKVPQQTNFIDCGVYVLQYVESFFKRPITDYRMPIKSIREWFSQEEVNRKRYDIMQLLLSLMREQNIDIASLNLPHLDLNPFPEYEPDDDEDVMDDEGEYGEEGLEEEEPMVEDEEEEEEEEEDDDTSFHTPTGDLLKHRTYLPRPVPPRMAAEMGARMEMRSSRLEVPRLEQPQRQPQRRFDSPSPRVESRSEVRTEAVRSVEHPSPSSTSRPKISDAVTICEANSKRKLPLSLKDIRNPRVSSPQTSIEKVKKMRVD